MPSNTYKCSGCGFTEEYIEGAQTSKEMHHPEFCPQCKVEKLEKVFDFNNSQGGFDIVGYCYENVYGKKNWKKHLSLDDQTKVLNGTKDPY